MSLLTCIGIVPWCDPYATLARFKVAYAFQKAGVEFVEGLGQGAQSWACHVRYAGEDYCLKLSHVSDDNGFGKWEPEWGTRPWDLPIFAQADFYLDFNNDNLYHQSKYHIKAQFTLIGVTPNPDEAEQARLFWRNLGYDMLDRGYYQWVKVNGQILLTDFSCIPGCWQPETDMSQVTPDQFAKYVYPKEANRV